MFFKTRTSEGPRLMPTLPRFDTTFESEKLVKDLPENSRFFFAASFSALCRVRTSAIAAILLLRRSSLLGAAGIAEGAAKVVEVGDEVGERAVAGGDVGTTTAAVSGPPSSSFG